MLKIFIAIALIALAVGPAVATDETDAMVTVKQFVSAFNKGDVAAVAATCAEQTSIIDEFAPYEWHGTGSCTQWMNDYDADAKKNGMTDGVVTLGKARHVDVVGDRAYVVVPASFVFKMKGKMVRELGSTLTVALQKGEGGWRITGWSWSKR